MSDVRETLARRHVLSARPPTCGMPRCPITEGACCCGESSGLLDSDAARRAWHRQHVAEVTAIEAAS